MEDLFLDNFCAVLGRDTYPAILSEDLRAEPANMDPHQSNMQYLTNPAAPDLLSRIQYLDLKSELVELLMGQDSIASASALEARAPFLDLEMVLFSLKVPADLKLRGRTGKAIERMAFSNLLPPEVVSRRKMGFPAPLSSWLAGKFHQRVADTIMGKKALERGYFGASQVRRLLEAHRRGKRDFTDALWLLYTFELWHQRFLDGH